MRVRYQITLLVVVVLAVYYPAIFAPLNSVDDPGMYQYLLNTDNFQLRGIFFPGGAAGYYRPLLLISFLIDKYVWGLEESFMHLDNILLHLCNTLLVFALTRRVCRVSGWSLGGAFFAALLFAVHPINTESVSWISGRTDPLTACFLLLSVLALLYRGRPVLSSVVSALCMLLACLVKETAIFYLPAALLFPFFLPAEKKGFSGFTATLMRNLHHFAVFLLAGAGYFLLRSRGFSKADEGVAQVVTSVAAKQHATELLPHLRLIFRTTGFYGKKLFLPFPLNFGISQIPEAYIFVGVLVCALLVYLVLRRSLVSFCWACVASIGSSAILIAFLSTTWTPVAERYMYIPSTFFLISLTLSIQQSQWLSRYRNQVVAMTLLLAVVAIYGTFTRNLLWQDNLAFFQDTVRKNPGFMPARNELATALKVHGRTKEATEIYKSFQIMPGLKNYQYGLVSKAAAYAEEGDIAAGRKILQDALKSPGKHEVLILEKMLDLNKLEISQGKAGQASLQDDSVKCLTRLYTLTGNPFYQYRLGIMSMQGKHEQQALAAFSEVCKRAPQDVFYRKSAERLTASLTLKLGEKATGGNLKP